MQLLLPVEQNNVAWVFGLHPHADLDSIRRIYIANFAIFKIATFWSYHLHLCEKIAKFQFHETSRFLVGSAHVRSQATVHAFMHSCMQRMQYAWGPRIYRRKYPRSRDDMSQHFCGYHLHWLTSLETSRHFRKIALRLAIFLAMFREYLCVVARATCTEMSRFF